MATINVKDASDSTVAIEKPLTPGRAAAASSRPVALSTEDKTALDRIAPVTLGASEDRTFNATSAQSSALTATLVRLVAKSADCRVLFGSNPTALATSPLLMEGVEYYFAMTSGHKIAAIRDNTTDGTLNIVVVG